MNRITFARRPLVAALALLPLALPLGAAELGDTSTETMTVSVTKAAAVRITGVDDVDFGSAAVAPATGFTANEAFCVFSNTGAYSLSITSATSTDTTFAMASGDNTLDYTVDLVLPTPQPVDSGVENGPFTVINPPLGVTDCGGLTNASMNVAIAAATFDAAPAGAYTDTLTLVVSPE